VGSAESPPAISIPDNEFMEARTDGVRFRRVSITGRAQGCLRRVRRAERIRLRTAAFQWVPEAGGS
jgi:hypothetical protein